MDKQGRESSTEIDAASPQAAIAKLRSSGLIALSSPEMIGESQTAAAPSAAECPTTVESAQPEGVRVFRVFAGVATRCGYRASLKPYLLRVDPQGHVSLKSLSQNANEKSGNAALAGGLAGGLVGAVVGGLVQSAIDKANRGGKVEIQVDVARGRGYYDQRKHELSLELPDGRWVDAKFMVKGKERFGEALALLQAVYGTHLIPGSVGRLSGGRIFALILILAIPAAIIACLIIAEHFR
jgi:hypothetical protein